MTRLTFTIEGQLPSWKRASQVGGVRRTTTKQREAKKHVARCAFVAMTRQSVKMHPPGVALGIECHFYQRREVTATPDADNLLKLICDGLSGVAFADDKQVARKVVEKHDVRLTDGQDAKPRAEVTIWALETPRKARSIEPTNASLPARRNIEPCPRCAVVNGHMGWCLAKGKI